MKILIINHGPYIKCGVYRHAERMGDILSKSAKHEFIHVCANSAEDIIALYEEQKPEVILYNYYPSIMPWITAGLIKSIPAKHVGLVHEITQAGIDAPYSMSFDAAVVTNPGVDVEGKPRWFKTVRPIFDYDVSNINTPNSITIGSFGFLFFNKGFDKVVSAVNNEFDDALIKLHLTIAQFSGNIAMDTHLSPYSYALSRLANKPQVRLVVTTYTMTDREVVEFLAGNTLNCLFYDPNPGRGASSAVDYMVSAGRPILLTRSEQFSHVNELLPVWPDTSLHKAIEKGNDKVLQLKEEWSHPNFIKQYEDIVEKVVSR